MGQKIRIKIKKYWRKKPGTRGLHDAESISGIWLKAAAVRAVKTVAQAAIASIGTSAAMSDVNWRFVVSTSLLSGILSMLTSFAGLPEVNNAIKEEKEND